MYKWWSQINENTYWKREWNGPIVVNYFFFCCTSRKMWNSQKLYMKHPLRHNFRSSSDCTLFIHRWMSPQNKKEWADQSINNTWIIKSSAKNSIKFCAFTLWNHYFPYIACNSSRYKYKTEMWFKILWKSFCWILKKQIYTHENVILTSFVAVCLLILSFRAIVE
jgi:hypothetical protein